MREGEGEIMAQESVIVQQESERKNQVQEIAMIGVFTALTLVFTAMINIKLPFGQGGLIHMGNIPLFLGAILFGKRTGMIAGAVGMGVFDLLSGWTAWAPFTFIIVGSMGFVVGAVTEKNKSFSRCVIAIILALIIKVIGYYFAEVFLYHNFITPFASIFGNVMQVCVAGVMVVILIPIIRKAIIK